jgi:hypothetical protein
MEKITQDIIKKKISFRNWKLKMTEVENKDVIVECLYITSKHK